MRTSPVLLAIAVTTLMLGSGARAEIYKTVDKDGNVTYSDRPSDDAEPVEVGPTNRMTETMPPAPVAKDEPAPVDRPYTAASITEPANGASISDPVGNFTVRYTLEPQRRPTDSVRLMMDNTPTGMPVADGIMVQGAPRGDHRLQIQVVDSTGRLLAQSGSVRILVVRPGPGGRRTGAPTPTPR